MPVQVWTPGQILTAAELTTVTNMLLFPTTLAGNLNPGVVGNLYICTASLTLTLPSPAVAGQVIGVKVRGTSLTVTVNRNASEHIFGPVGITNQTSLSLTTDGQIVVLLSDGTNWQVIEEDGFGYAQGATVGTNQSTASATYTDLATSGPAVTVNTNTTAFIALGAYMQSATANAIEYMAFAVSGATTLVASDSFACALSHATANGTEQAGITFVQSGLTQGSNVFTAKYRVNAGTEPFANRNIVVQPLPL